MAIALGAIVGGAISNVDRPPALRRGGGLHPRRIWRLVLVRVQCRGCSHRMRRRGPGARRPAAARRDERRAPSVDDILATRPGLRLRDRAMPPSNRRVATTLAAGCLRGGGWPAAVATSSAAPWASSAIAPDEFTVTTRAPLAMPPSFALPTARPWRDAAAGAVRAHQGGTRAGAADGPRRTTRGHQSRAAGPGAGSRTAGGGGDPRRGGPGGVSATSRHLASATS